MSVNIGSLVGTLKVIDEASGVIGQVQGAIGSITGVMSKMGGAMGDLGAGINTTFSGFATGGPAGAALAAGAFAIGEVFTGIQNCMKEATASEAVWASLAAAVTRSGVAWDTVSEATKSALLAMQKTTTYSDEQLAAALERLMTFGLSYDEAMKALGSTIDFAAAKHMDLESAATLVGKAMDGNTAIMKRYGVDITTTKEATAALKDAHDVAKTAIESMGKGVDAWVVSVSAAIAATPEFEAGLAGAKDKAGYLIEQFQQGNIDLPQFTQAMTSLGVPLDDVKLKAGGAEEVLGALNTQFGGAAQAAAGTYAGIQERLKNATSEVSEKIGMMFLPALASLTEGMIPVVDWLGEGVDAISGWLTEVGKMPEVQGILTAVGDAFSGFMKYLQDLWGFIVDQFGPVLTELMGAFKELWDALSPIGEAIGEMIGAMSGGGEGMDLFKIAIQAIVFEIKGIVEIIKIVAPYIKDFADAFKAAADFIVPVLEGIHDAITGFLDALKNAFQGFYTWLVGGSLWMDMWNALLSVASSMIGTLLGDLGTKLFEPMKNAFTGAMQWVEDSWNKGWQAVQTSTMTAMDQVFTDVNMGLDAVIGALSEKYPELAPIAKSGYDAIKSAQDAVLDLMKGDWQGFLDGLISSFTSWGETAKGIWDSVMSGVEGAVDGGISQVQNAWGDMTSNLQQATQAAAAPMQSAAQGVMDAVGGAVTGFWNWLTGGSYWPEQLERMRGMTETKLGETAQAFVNFGHQVGANLQSALGQAQQVAQQGMNAISQALGGVGQEITKVLNFNAPDLNAIAQQIYETTAAMGKAASDPEVFDDAAIAVSNGLMTIDQAVSDWLTGGTLTQQIAEKMHQTWMQMTYGADAAAQSMKMLGGEGAKVQTILANIVPTFAGESAQTFANAIKNMSLAVGQSSIDIDDLRVRLYAMEAAGLLADETMDGLSDTLDGFRHAMSGIPEDVFEDFTDPALIAQINAMGETIQTVSKTTTTSTQDMKDVTVSALDTISSTFQDAFDTISTAATGFWNWLVGGSVWTDMLDALQTTTEPSLAYLGQLFYDNLTLIGTTVSDALLTMQTNWALWRETELGSETTFWSQIVGLFQSSLMTMQIAVDTFWTYFMNLTVTKFTEMAAFLKEAFTGKAGLLISWQTWLGTMSTQTDTYMSVVVGVFKGACNSIESAARQLWAALVGGSIWPQMLDEMIAVTSTKMAALEAMMIYRIDSMLKAYQGARQAMVGGSIWQDIMNQMAPPTLPYPGMPAMPRVVNPEMLAQYPLLQSNPLAAMLAGQSYTLNIPVQVILDGEVVQQSVERRLVTNYRLGQYATK